MQQPKTFFEKIDSFFDRIAILELSDEQKKGTAIKCSTLMHGDFAYWSQVVISSIIATFGLLQNSVAVIIGAMLIAPLFKPIQGMAFGIAQGNQGAFINASLLLIKSIVVSVLIACVGVWLVPFHIETAEILARTTPNLIDLLIAIASAIIAFLAIYFEELSESIGGVAMATSLMPPLAVVGIELALGNVSRSWGSLFLFLTNLFAILLVGTLMFFLYGFSPHQRTSQKLTLQKLGVLAFLGLLIVVPLGSSLFNLSDSVNLRIVAQVEAETVLAEVLPSATLSNIELLENTGDLATLKGTVTLPEGTEFLEEMQKAIQQRLTDRLERDITLKLEVLRVASIVSKKSELASLELKIRDALRKQLLEKVPMATIVKTDIAQIQQSPKAEGDEDSIVVWGIKSVLALPADADFNADVREVLKTEMQALFSQVRLEFFWIYLPQQQQNTTAEQSPRLRHSKEQTLRWDSFFADTLPAEASAENFSIAWEKTDTSIADFSEQNIAKYSVRFSLYLPGMSAYQQRQLENAIEEFSETFEKPMSLTYRIIPFTSVEVLPN